MSFMKLWILPDILWNIPSHKGIFGFTDTINSPFPLFTSATTCKWKTPHVFTTSFQAQFKFYFIYCFTINWVLCLFCPTIEVKLSLQSLLSKQPQINWSSSMHSVGKTKTTRYSSCHDLPTLPLSSACLNQIPPQFLCFILSDFINDISVVTDVCSVLYPGEVFAIYFTPSNLSTKTHYKEVNSMQSHTTNALTARVHLTVLLTEFLDR